MSSKMEATKLYQINDKHELVKRLVVMNPAEKERLLANTMYDFNVAHDKSSEIIMRLRAEEFFEAPASTKYHGNFEGGLFVHSYAMFCALYDFTNMKDLKWVRATSPLYIGVFHDFCKCGKYERDLIIADDGTIQPQGFSYKEKPYPIGGHAFESIIKAQTIPGVDLTREEILCIRWHMGPYEGPDFWKDYGRAIELNEKVLWTHHADMYVSKVLGV